MTLKRRLLGAILQAHSVRARVVSSIITLNLIVSPFVARGEAIDVAFVHLFPNPLGNARRI